MKVRTLVKLVSAAILLCGMALAQTPVLCFSDLTFGPNTGWNNGSTQGAAVTVWGKNFAARAAHGGACHERASHARRV